MPVRFTAGCASSSRSVSSTPGARHGGATSSCCSIPAARARSWIAFSFGIAATQRGRGRGLGWRIAIQRHDERHEVARAGTEARPYGATYPAPPEGRGIPGAPSAGAPSDPHHH